MKIAITFCRQRVAPLFEVAETFLMQGLEGTACEPIILETRHPRIEEKCWRLYMEGTRVLLCGALSHQWMDHLQQLGIRVHAFLAGDAHEIMNAYLQNGAEGLARFAMPGCKGKRRGRQR